MATRPTAPRHLDRPVRHRLTALVAVYAVLAQILLGALAAAFGPSALAGDRSPLAQLAELCTPDGLVRIAYPDQADGAPARTAPKCPFCLGGGPAAVPEPCGSWIVAPPFQIAQADWHEADASGAAAHRIIEIRPRAPPLAT